MPSEHLQHAIHVLNALPRFTVGLTGNSHVRRVLFMYHNSGVWDQVTYFWNQLWQGRWTLLVGEGLELLVSPCIDMSFRIKEEGNSPQQHISRPFFKWALDQNRELTIRDQCIDGYINYDACATEFTCLCIECLQIRKDRCVLTIHFPAIHLSLAAIGFTSASSITHWLICLQASTYPYCCCFPVDMDWI